MIINLFISRVVLKELGVEDYGIYNIVGGIVVMMSLFTNNMSTTTQRFISFELAKDNVKSSQKVFSTAITIHFILGIFVFVIAEIAGVWFILNKLNIPPDRLFAAQAVFQCSLLSFIITLLSVPYNASIVAHERMNAFAYISVLEAILKLCSVLCLSYFMQDKLIVYGILLLMVAIIIRIIYNIYCFKNFEECKFIIVKDKNKYKAMAGFAGWSFVGTTASVLNDEGVNILINLFFGVTLNAARGIAVQVQHAVMNFVNSFMTSINPQIVKNYSTNNIDEFTKMVMNGAKYSFFLYIIMAIPIYIEADNILHIWLTSVPEYTVLFIRLTLCVTAFYPLTNTLIIGVLATGKVKKYYLSLGILNLLCLPLSYVILKIALQPELVYYILIFVNFILLILRPFFLRKNISFPIKRYLIQTIKLILISLLLVYICYQVSFSFRNRFIQLIINTLVSVIITLPVLYLVGLDKNEKKIINSRILKYLRI